MVVKVATAARSGGIEGSMVWDTTSTRPPVIDPLDSGTSRPSRGPEWWEVVVVRKREKTK